MRSLHFLFVLLCLTPLLAAPVPGRLRKREIPTFSEVDDVVSDAISKISKDDSSIPTASSSTKVSSAGKSQSLPTLANSPAKTKFLSATSKIINTPSTAWSKLTSALGVAGPDATRNEIDSKYITAMTNTRTSPGLQALHGAIKYSKAVGVEPSAPVKKAAQDYMKKIMTIDKSGLEPILDQNGNPVEDTVTLNTL